MPYSLYLRKENFKFSSSHFTIFDRASAEFLHGHNYQVSVRLAFDDVDPASEMKVDFNVVKKEIRELCDHLDEKILIPKKSEFLKILPSPHHRDHTEVTYADRHYCFPNREILFLPVHNITSEALARFLHGEFLKRFPKEFAKVAVGVTETAGQTATYS